MSLINDESMVKDFDIATGPVAIAFLYASLDKSENGQ